MPDKSSAIVMAAFLALGLSACESTDVSTLGNRKLAALPTDAPVDVFMTESSVKRNFDVVGTIHHVEPGTFQDVKLNDVLPVIKEKALSLGANGVIIKSFALVDSGLVNGIDVAAVAIKY